MPNVGIALGAAVVKAIGDAALTEALQELRHVPILIERKGVAADVAHRRVVFMQRIRPMGSCPRPAGWMPLSLAAAAASISASDAASRYRRSTIR